MSENSSSPEAVSLSLLSSLSAKVWFLSLLWSKQLVGSARLEEENKENFTKEL